MRKIFSDVFSRNDDVRNLFQSSMNLFPEYPNIAVFQARSHGMSNVIDPGCPRYTLFSNRWVNRIVKMYKGTPATHFSNKDYCQFKVNNLVIWCWLGDVNSLHWGRLTHICVGKRNIIGSDNDLSPGRRQAIIWTNAGLLSIWPLGTNLVEILIEIYIFSFKKMSSGKWRPFCLGLNVLRTRSSQLSHGISLVFPEYYIPEPGGLRWSCNFSQRPSCYIRHWKTYGMHSHKEKKQNV